MSNNKKITIVGAGSWGTTIALLLSKKSDLDVSLWAAFEDHARKMKKDDENQDFLPGYQFGGQLEVISELSEAMTAEIVILAVPVQFMRAVLKQIKSLELNISSKIFVTVSKGIELATLKTPFEMIEEELGVSKDMIAVLSGPTIAKEVARGVPTVAASACESVANAQAVQSLFEGTSMRVYSNTDVAGVELAGALKNVIAISCGISDGLGFGTNTKSALITRGLIEMQRFGALYDVRPETLAGVTGLGDLCTTCFSPDSRNRTLGEKIGSGMTLDEVLSGMKMVAEGVVTCKSVYKLSHENGIEMPIVSEVYKVLYENKSPKDAVSDLMHRPLKSE